MSSARGELAQPGHGAGLGEPILRFGNVAGRDRQLFGEAIGFHPEQRALPGVLGILLPIVVWMGEKRFGPAALLLCQVD